MRDYDAIKEALTFYAATAETTRKTRALLDAADAIEELVADNTEAFSADFISMQNAVETDVWLMVWAAEPNREIHVQMTYDELWKIVQRERENAIEPPKEVLPNGEV